MARVLSAGWAVGWAARWAAALATLLVACGGDPVPQPAAPASSASPALLSSLVPPGSPPTKRALQAAPASVPVDALLDWVERTWPTLFPRGPATETWEVGGQVYQLRAYPNAHFVGVSADGTVWGLGSFTGQVLTSYGPKDDYLCLVSPERCQEPPRCKTEISTGFAGDLNAVYTAPGGGDGGSGGGGDSGSGGGSGGGDDGGSSAGIGGSEGKVLGARFRAYRLADGELLAQGLTDTTQGLATIRWCPADLPVLLELQGAPGARYYDEALDRLVDFPLTQKLRALVDRFDENVGVSALTEAAYVYALNQLHAGEAERRAIAEGRAPLRTDGVPAGLSAAQVRQANRRVLEEVNNRLSEPLQQVSMKALATPVDSSSARSALPRNRYGRMAALTGGFAKLARGYDRDEATPALAFTRQFALDFSDGRLDEHTAAGQIVATAGSGGAARRSYQASSASLDFTLGQGAMGQRFGQGTTQLDAEPYVGFEQLWIGYAPQTCRRGLGHTAIGNHHLSTIGTVTRVVYEAPPGGCIWDPGTTRTVELDHLRGVRRLVGGSVDRLYAITTEGELYAWGWHSCGRLGDGQLGDTIATRPVKVVGLPRVVDLVYAGGVTLALSAEGEVWSWGPDYNGAAGHGPDPSAVRCEDGVMGPALTRGFGLPVITAPRRIEGLSQIVALAANPGWSSVTAVDREGRRYEWGQVPDPAGGTVVVDRPRLAPTPSPVLKISASPSMFFGIARGGRVLTWWLEPEAIFEGQSAATLSQPRWLDGVSDVVDLVSDAVGGTLALRSDGSVMTWGRWRRHDGDVTLTPRLASGFPVVDSSDPDTPRRLPRLVRLTVLGGFVAAVGADGLTYRFLPAPVPGEFRWDLNQVHAGVPSPY